MSETTIPLDDVSKRILQRLVIVRNQAHAAMKQAEEQFKGADLDCANYVGQICQAKGLDKETYGVTPDLSAIVPRPPEAKP